MKSDTPKQKPFARACEKAVAFAESFKRLIRDSVRKRVGGDDPEEWIREFNRLSAKGHSGGWRFDRNEIHERR
jgi:hypothetical protein